MAGRTTESAVRHSPQPTYPGTLTVRLTASPVPRYGSRSPGSPPSPQIRPPPLPLSHRASLAPLASCTTTRGRSSDLCRAQPHDRMSNVHVHRVRQVYTTQAPGRTGREPCRRASCSCVSASVALCRRSTGSRRGRSDRGSQSSSARCQGSAPARGRAAAAGSPQAACRRGRTRAAYSGAESTG